MKIAFVVLNYKTADSTIESVDSIFKLSVDPSDEVRVLLVDNGSRDGSWEKLNKELGNNPNVLLIKNRKNLGFAGGQSNLKSEVEKYDYACLVNTDAVLAKDWLEKGLQTFKSNPKLAAVGGKAFDWNKDNQSYSIKNGFYSYQLIDPLDVNSITLRSGESLKNVDTVSGAGLILDVKKSMSVGYFNKKYFLYYEESDLEARLIRAGYDVMYNPKMHIWHKIGLSSESEKRKFNKVMFYYMFRNRFFFAFTNFDKEYSNIFAQRYITQSLKLISPRKSNISRGEKILIAKSLFWIAINFVYLLWVRRKIYTLGDTYSQKLTALNKDQSVSVIIPCYNYAEYLDECVESVLNQTHPASKIIIINDGSTDATEKVMSKYSKLPNVHTYSQENKGVVETKNFGLSKIDTKWVIFLDADDSINPTYIEEVLGKAELDRLDLVYTDAYLVGAKNERIEYQEFDYKQLYNRNFIHNSALMRTEIIKHIGGYRLKEGYEDWEMYIRFSKFSQKIARLPKPLLYYRQHQATTSRNNQANAKDYELRELVQSLYPFQSFTLLDEPYKIKSPIVLGLIELTKKILKRPYLLLLSPLLLLYIPIRVSREVLVALFKYTANFYRVKI